MKQLLYRLTDEVIKQSNWWEGYIDGDPYQARFVLVKLEEYGLCMVQQTTGRKAIRLYTKDIGLDCTKEEEIALRINKLYSKCKTTKHWSTE